MKSIAGYRVVMNFVLLRQILTEALEADEVERLPQRIVLTELPSLSELARFLVEWQKSISSGQRVNAILIGSLLLNYALSSSTVDASQCRMALAYLSDWTAVLNAEEHAEEGRYQTVVILNRIVKVVQHAPDAEVLRWAQDQTRVIWPETGYYQRALAMQMISFPKDT